MTDSSLESTVASKDTRTSRAKRMTNEETEKLVSALEDGEAGIEVFLALPADDRARIMAMLEQRIVSKEVGQINNLWGC